MRWQKTLEDALQYKNTIILCGNVRDKYLYPEPHATDQYRRVNREGMDIKFLFDEGGIGVTGNFDEKLLQKSSKNYNGIYGIVLTEKGRVSRMP